MSLEIQADYAVKSGGIDTLLAGDVSEILIDADRIVREDFGFNNGFPNWDLYRVCYAGDDCQLGRLREWCVGHAVDYCQRGGVKRSVYSEDLACVAAWDALYMLIFGERIQPYTVTAADLGVHEGTYKRVSSALYWQLRFSMEEYIGALRSATMRVLIRYYGPNRGFDE